MFGKTPSEWGALAPDERAYLEAAYADHRERNADALTNLT